MNKKRNKFLFLLAFFLLLQNISFSLECLKVNIEPIKDKLILNNETKKDFLEFNVLLENRCDKDLRLKLAYNDFVYYVYFQPNELVLPEDSIKKVNIKIYPPSYISSGWKAVRINIYGVDNKKIKEFYLKFYLKNPNYKVEVKKEYVYLIKTLIQNLDLLIDAPKEVKSWKDKWVDFSVVLFGVNQSIFNEKDFELIVLAKNGEKELPLAWNYLNSLKNDFVEIREDKIIFNNKFLADFSVDPGLYTIEAFFTLKDEDFEVSERAYYNLLIEGSPFFVIEEKKEKGLFKTVVIYKIKNIGNKEGKFEFVLPLNFFKKLFINYDFEAELRDGKLIKVLKLSPKESETLVISYNYTSLVIFIILVLIFAIIYYYLNYFNPISIKKDITKISLSKDDKSFYIEVTLRNNSLRTFKDLVVLEKISNGVIDELSVVPRYDYIKKDLTLSKIRWTLKELRPRERVKLIFKIKAKDSNLVVSYPTKVKIGERIYYGKGLKIYLKDSIKIEEFSNEDK